MKIATSLEKKVKRGPDSWIFFYAMLAIFLSLEGNIIQILGLPLLWSIGLFLFAAVVTGYGILDNAWVQNKLVGFKIKIEDKWRAH